MPPRLRAFPLARVYQLLEPGLQVVKAWARPARRRPRTIHHLGHGRFMAAGRVFRLPSRAR